MADGDRPNDPVDAETFYDNLGRSEWERLDRGFFQRLEFEGTLEYMERYLTDTGHVLDAGGGPGRYTIWLAQRGYDVTLIDISSEQLRVAEQKIAQRDLPGDIEIDRGDIRNLDFDEETFDATLCVGGPISNILSANERETAVGELQRVTRSGGRVFISVMGRLAVLQSIVQLAGKVPAEKDETELLPDLAEHGTYDQNLLDRYGRDSNWLPLHLFRVSELEDLLEKHGLEVEVITGLEGIASVRQSGLNNISKEKQESVEKSVELLMEDRSVADISKHILSVSKVL